MYKELQEELFEDTDDKVQNNVEIEKRGKRAEMKPIDEVADVKINKLLCPICKLSRYKHLVDVFLAYVDIQNAIDQQVLLWNKSI